MVFLTAGLAGFGDDAEVGRKVTIDVHTRQSTRTMGSCWVSILSDIYIARFGVELVSIRIDEGIEDDGAFLKELPHISLASPAHYILSESLHELE